MDEYDLSALFGQDEPTPEEKARAMAAALRGQSQAADVTSAIGNLGLLTGDKVLGRFGSAQLADAQNIRNDTTRAGMVLQRALGLNKKPAALITNQGMEQAVKDKFPDIWERLRGGKLTDAAWSKVFEQASNDARMGQRNANTESRFSRSYALTAQKQAADLGTRKVYGAVPLDQANPQLMSQTQAEKLADMRAAADTVFDKTEEAKKLYGKGGLIVPGSTQDAQLRQLIVETYGPMLKTGNIGNLTDSHLHLLQDMLANPAGDWRSFINDERFPAMLEGLAKGAKKNLLHQARSMGQTFPDLDDKAVHPAGWDDASERRLKEVEAALAKKRAGK